MKQKKASKQENPDGSEESTGGLDRYSVRIDRNLTEQKQQQENIPAGEGSNLTEAWSILHNPGQVWEMSY